MRLLPSHLKASPKTVARAWRAYGIQLWRTESFRIFTDPDLGKVVGVVGLYLASSEKAVALCTDVESQVQAVDRIQPI